MQTQVEEQLDFPEVKKEPVASKAEAARWLRSQWNNEVRDSLLISAHLILMAVIAALFLYYNRT